MTSCNVAGTHKLPFLILGKSKNPRGFKNATLPCIYKSTNKGWMTRPLLQEWFRKYFIPEVKKFLTEVNKSHTPLLIVDNAPSHPPEEKLNFNPDFKVLFLPTNCTAILQPLDPLSQH